MLALVGAVFAASLLGSAHCAGMCGAFVAFAVAGADGPAPSRTALNAAYNLGRLATYVALGAAAGLVGSAIDLGGSAVGLQRAAAILAGSIMVVFAIVTVLRHRGVRVPGAAVPAPLRRAVAAGHKLAFALPPMRRAVAIGLLTTLLPCGWLYAFVVTAAGTGDPALGAGTMAAFWLGTLPVMAALGAGIQSLAGPLRARLPVATAVVLAAVGLWTIFGRVDVPAFAAAPDGDAAPPCCPPAPAGVEEALDRLDAIDATELPCCHGG